MLDQKEFLLEEEPVDIRKYINKVAANWYWFAVSLAIAFTVAYMVNRYAQPLYSLSSTIILKENRAMSGISGSEDVMQGINFGNSNTISNELMVLSSYYLNRQVVENLALRTTYYAIGRRGIRETMLYQQAPYKVRAIPGAPLRINYPVMVTILSDSTYLLEINDSYDIHREMKFGEAFVHPDFNFTLEADAGQIGVYRHRKVYFVQNDLNRLTNEFRRSLSVSHNDQNGSVISLTFRHCNIKLASDYLNELARVYVQYGLEEKNLTAINTINFIDSQLGSISDSLNQAEDNLQNFRLTNKVVDLSQEGSMMFEKLSEVQSEKAIITMKINYYQYLLNYLNDNSDLKDVIFPVAFGISDGSLSSMISQLGQLYSERAVLSLNANENSPVLVSLNTKIAMTRQGMQENITNNLKAQQISLANIESRIRKAEGEISKLPVTERKLISYERKFNLNNEVYNYLLQKRTEASIAKAAAVPDNKLLDPALGENALLISPKRRQNLTIALLLGLLVPFVILFAIDYFNNRIDDISEITRRTRLTIIGRISHNPYKIPLPVVEKPKSSLAESFRGLRTNLQYLTSQGQKVISITSAVSGEGKTFCSANLAAIIAMSGKKVLLTGLDLRKPKLHDAFGLKSNKGLSTYLVGKSTFDEIVMPTAQENLYVVPAGPVPPNPVELLESERLSVFVDVAREAFDFVIFDTPPVAIVSDALTINKYIDLNLFVVRQNYTVRHVYSLLAELQETNKIEKYYLVVNDMKIPSYYGYNYGYGYHYSKGYYDVDIQRNGIGFKWSSVFSARESGRN